MSERIIAKDAEELAARAAQWIVQAAEEAIRARGRFTMALAGGSTPEKTYSLLAQPERAAKIAWDKTLIFFSDERFVPSEDPVSNFGMANRALLRRVPVPSSNVFPVPTDRKTAAESAAAYAETLGNVFSLSVNATPPRFDLILLGLGDDGHTASLFPHAVALGVKDAWVTSSPPGILPPPVDRITFTYPLLNAGRQVVFLVSGPQKAAVAQEVLEGHSSPETHPAAGVQPKEGALIWLLDEAAAGRLAGKA